MWNPSPSHAVVVLSLPPSNETRRCRMPLLLTALPRSHLPRARVSRLPVPPFLRQGATPSTTFAVAAGGSPPSTGRRLWAVACHACQLKTSCEPLSYLIWFRCGKHATVVRQTRHRCLAMPVDWSLRPAGEPASKSASLVRHLQSLWLSGRLRPPTPPGWCLRTTCEPTSVCATPRCNLNYL